MSGFISTVTGFAAVSAIDTISRNRDGKAALRMRDETERTSIASFEDIVQDLGQVVQNTTEVVAIRMMHCEIFEDGDDPVLFDEHHIIAWRITPIGAIPILPLNIEPTHIRYPDGTVISMIGDEFADLATARKEFLAQVGATV